MAAKKAKPFTPKAKKTQVAVALNRKMQSEEHQAGRKEKPYSFSKNPNSTFRGKKTGMKRPEGRKR